MSDPTEPFAGRSILVVEDEYLIALHLAAILEGYRADVVGPVGNMEDALQLARTTPKLDGALLNIKLGSELVFPVVDALEERHVPFVFVTAYEWEAIPERYAHVPRFPKDPDLTRLAKEMFS